MALYSKEWWYPSGDPAIAVRALVFYEDQSTLAPIFADAGLTVPLTNPTTTDGAGVLTFYVPDGRYWIYVGDDFSGDSELVTISPSVTGTVLSVNDVGPDDFGNVELTADDIGAQPLDAIDAKGDLYVGTGPDATTRLGRGSDGQVLATNSATATGLEWKNTPADPVLSVNQILPDVDGNVQLTALSLDAQPIGTITFKGDLYVGIANDDTDRLGAGTDGQVLSANSAQFTGLEWIDPPSAPVTSVQGLTGDVVLDADSVGADPAGSAAVAQAASLQKEANLSDVADPADARFHLGLGDSATLDVGTTAGTVAAGDDTRITGAQQRSILITKGDVYVATAPGVTTRLGAGLDGQFLTSDSGSPEGLSWFSPPASPVLSVNTQTGAVILDADDVGAIPVAIVDAPGDLITATGADTPVRLPVGMDGEVLTADSSDPSGLAWSSPAGTGDVDGPESADDMALARFDGITGKLIQNSSVTLDDGGTFNIFAQVGPFANDAGDFYYDDDRQALVFASGITPIILGQQNMILVNNDSGDVMAAGTPVYVTGHEEVYPYPPFVDRAKSDSAVTARCVGLTAGIIANGDDGYVVIDGLLSPFPTLGYSEGDYLYVSSVIAGALTNVRPVPPDYAVCVGIVTVSDLTHGAISVFRTEANVGDGDVQGPASSTDSALTRFDGTSGKVVQDSGVTLSDAGTFTLPDQTGPFSSTDGALYYDGDYQSLAFEDNIRVLHLERQTVMLVNNPVGGTIGRGAPVYINGHIDVFPYTPTIGPAQANGGTTGRAVGVTADNINDGSDGYIVLEGLLENFPTVAWNPGDYLYVSPSVAGGLTVTRPSAPNQAVCIAQVSVVDITHGALTVMRSEATLGWGTANQVRGVNAAGTAEEYKTIAGTTNRLTVTQGVGSVTLDVSSTLSDSKVDKSTLSAKGSLISATGAATPVNVGVGTNGQVLTADSAQTAGVAWTTPPTAPVTSVNGQTGVVNLTAASVGAPPTTRAITAGTALTGGGDLSADRTLNVNVGTTAGSVAAGNDTRITGAIQSSTLTAKGSLISASGAATPVNVGVGANGQVLTADSAQASGVAWATPASAPVTSVNGQTGVVNLTAANVGAPPTTRNITTTNGLTGGGDLSADRTIQPTYGTTVNTVAQGNDTRITGAIQSSTLTAKGSLISASGAATPVNVVVGTNGQILRANSATASGVEWATDTGTGDVVGPASSTDNALTRFDATSGKLVQNSNTTLDDSGVFILGVSNIPAGPTTGQMWYDGVTLNIRNDQAADMTIRYGFGEYMRVSNTGVALNAGTAVYINAANTPPSVQAARADVISTASCIGILTHQLSNGEVGYVLTSGTTPSGLLDTSGMTVGAPIYLSAAVSGALTTTRPSAPNQAVRVGTVGVVSNIVGAIQVNPQQPVLGTATNGQVEVARSAAQGGTAWVPPPSAGVVCDTGGYMPAGGVVVTRTTANMVLNQMYLTPFYALNDFNLNEVVFEVTGITVLSTVRGGVYNGNGPFPFPGGAPIADFGTVATSTTGVKSFTPSVNLTAGLYYIALVSQGVVANIRFGSGFSPYVYSSPFPTGTSAGWQNCYTQAGVTGALPSIGSIASGSIAPVIGFS